MIKIRYFYIESMIECNSSITHIQIIELSLNLSKLFQNYHNLDIFSNIFLFYFLILGPLIIEIGDIYIEFVIQCNSSINH